MRFTLRRGHRVRGPRGRHARGGARPERRARRLPQHLPRPAARGLHGRRGGAERARPDRRAEPMLRATLVELEDGLERRAAGRQGPARRAAGAPPATTRSTRTATCSSSAAGASGLAAAAARRAGARSSSQSGPTLRAGSDGDLRVLDAARPRVGLYDGNYVLAVERGRRRRGTSGRSGSCSRPARSNGRWSSPDNDRPGVMLAGAARAVRARRRAGRRLHEQRHRARDPRRDRRRRPAGHGWSWTRSASGRLESVLLDDGSRCRVTCCAVSGGWSPRVHLWSQRGGRLRCDDRSARSSRTAARRRRGRRDRCRRAACPRSRRSGSSRGDEDARRSSTSSATRRSPTSAARSAPACARSSTSSATRRSAPAPTRARRPA